MTASTRQYEYLLRTRFCRTRRGKSKEDEENQEKPVRSRESPVPQRTRGRFRD
jgi:hypothetical protein